MRGRKFRLLMALLMISAFIFVFGCDEAEDVIAPVSTTEIYMSPIQLPSAPSGYVYEMWVTDTAGESYSLGKLLWDSYYHRFMDADSNRIDSVWTVDYDVLDGFYEYLDLSIEPYPDPFPLDQGPVFLRDTIGDPEVNPIQLVFPIDFGLSTANFAVETPTDKDSRANDAGGVWFALYNYDSVAVHDTTNMFLATAEKAARRLELDTTYWVCTQDEDGICVDSVDVTSEVLLDPGYEWDMFYFDTTNLAELAATLDTLAIICVDTVVDSLYILDPMIMDTFIHVTTEYEFVVLPVNVGSEDIDTIIIDPCNGDTIELNIEPFTDYIHALYPTTRQTTFLLDRFLSGDEEVPVLEDADWHYKGWIISPYLPADCPELGRLTKPEWSDFIVDQYFGDPDDWAVISTGSFKNWQAADETNLYSDNKRVPDFPGEDFLLNLPCGRTEPYYFADSTNPESFVGEVFVTLEPDGYDSNTNFPLVLFTTRLHIPSYEIVSDTTVDHVQGTTLLNVAERVTNNPFGFPGIDIIIKRK